MSLWMRRATKPLSPSARSPFRKDPGRAAGRAAENRDQRADSCSSSWKAGPGSAALPPWLPEAAQPSQRLFIPAHRRIQHRAVGVFGFGGLHQADEGFVAQHFRGAGFARQVGELKPARGLTLDPLRRRLRFNRSRQPSVRHGRRLGGQLAAQVASRFAPSPSCWGSQMGGLLRLCLAVARQKSQIDARIALGFMSTPPSGDLPVKASPGWLMR